MGWFSSGAEKRAKPLILHVDDSSVILLVTKGMMTKFGCDVILAQNGQEGIEAARKMLPDLILLDMLMPGIDGSEVCVQLKADPKTKDIPVIMVTGADTMKDVEKAMANGAAGYVVKPIQEERLKAKMSALIKLPNAG